MKNIVKKLADLIDVKSFVTFIVMGIYAVLSLRGKIAADRSMDVVFMVVAFYFGTQSAKKKTDNNDIDNNTAQ